MRLALWLLLLMLAAGAAPSGAESLFESYFSKADDGRPCYARLYTADHLAKHPRQRVSAIEISFQPANPDGVVNTPNSFDIGFGVRKRGGTEWFTNSAYCSAKADGFDCALEGDGGLFKLRPASGGRLRLELTRDTIGVEGSTSFFEFGGARSDDNVFLLSRAARRICDAAIAR